MAECVSFDDFYMQIELLARVNHTTLIRLMGVYVEKYAFIYQFMGGGTLEDRLVRNDLPWRDHIRKAVEICSDLVFRHLRKPDVEVRGDLKPSNILLNTRVRSKLGDFGICRIIPPCNATTIANVTATSLQGTNGYIDPAFRQSSRLQPNVDTSALA